MTRLDLNLPNGDKLTYEFTNNGKHRLVLDTKFHHIIGGETTINNPCLLIGLDGEAIYMAAVSLSGVRFYSTRRILRDGEKEKEA